jgi:hypothetical protein
MVLVFSDGENRLSWLEPRHVLEAARGLDAVVYGVVASSRRPSAHRGLLGELADVTGGAVLEAKGGDLAEAFRRILATVQSRYILRYVPHGVKGAGWHQVRVRLRHGSGDLRVRKGYRRFP